MMKKRKLAFLLIVALLISNIGITVFAAGGSGSMETESRKTARISLYQDGSLGNAYVEGSDILISPSYEEGSIEYVIYQGLKNVDEQIDVEAFGLNPEAAQNKYREVVNNNPDLFYVASSLQYYYYGDILTSFVPYYASTDKQELKTWKTQFDKAVSMALIGIDDSMNDMEKALFVHDYIVKNNAYDYINYMEDTIPNVSHSAYGALVLNTSVCDGYALAYSYLMAKIGVESHIVTGPGHAWNSIVADGEEYFVDCTFDDPVNNNEDMFGFVSHKYFMVTDDVLLNDGRPEHSSWDQDVSCTDITYKNAEFRDSENTYCYVDDNWYYLDLDCDSNEETNDPAIMKTSNPAVAGTMFTDLSALKWWVFGDEGGSYYPGYWGGLDFQPVNGELYYSSTNTVYSIDLSEGSSDAEVFKTINTTDGYAYGVVVKNNKLYYSVGKVPYQTLTTGSENITLKKLLIEDFTLVPLDEEMVKGATSQIVIEVEPAGENHWMYEFNWESSAPEVVSVDENGFITAHATGTAIITCSINYVEKDVQITVIEPQNVELNDFSFELPKFDLGPGGKYKPVLIYNPTNVYPIPEETWSSDDPTIATVDNTGLVSAVAPGTTTIRCTINGIERTIDVTVVAYEMGDVTADGEVDAIDALAILKRVAGMNNPVFIESVGNCDGDVAGNIDALDALWILKKVAGML